jgi:hypothetical protein
VTATTDEIISYFDKLKWWYKADGEAKVLTSYLCPVPGYYYVIAIEVATGQHWVNIRALLQRDIGSAHLDAVLQLISRWNEVIYRARFLLVGDCVVLQAEVSVAQLSLDLFVEALSAVCRYSTLAGVEIAAVATNPSLCTQFSTVMTTMKPRTWDDAITGEELDIDFDITMNRIPD